MSKPKKSSKNAKIPQPIKVKKEKTEEDRALHSMAHYVDDRLELVKQIFGSLKTKTITNLAPEYLKNMEMEEIQELCLNELLCLSTKRLLSIINATQCPTDTESSDENSDVEAKEEHVSLEEISSDSELENGGKSSKHARNKKQTKKANQKEDKAEPPAQMSVLELLELQARARAIRSQLALEPVTKIEVDSDDEAEAKDKDKTAAAEKSLKATKEKEKKSSKQSSKKQSKREEKSTSTSTKAKPDEESTTRAAKESQTSKQKIKIKRNFRNSRNQTSTEDTNDTPALAQKDEDAITPVPAKDVKKEKHSSRSQSPDVIPILPQPEVLCISDNSTDNEENDATETAKEAVTMKQPIPTKSSARNNEEEAEDGEILDQTETVETATASDEKTVSTVNNDEIVQQEEQTQSEINEEKNDGASLAPEKNAAELAEKIENAGKTASPQPTSTFNDDGEHSDDVISIEGGDLENEMSEHLDEDASSKQSGQSATATTASTSHDQDIVSIDSSENEDDVGNQAESECWQSRYMRSSKVHKVLAVSRLGKRVRDKLKTSKSSKANAEKSSKDDRPKPAKYVSKHEDGSVEQYKELIQMSQRKN